MRCLPPLFPFQKFLALSLAPPPPPRGAFHPLPPCRWCMAESLPALAHVDWFAMTPPLPLQVMSNDHRAEGIRHMIGRRDRSLVDPFASSLYPKGCMPDKRQTIKCVTQSHDTPYTYTSGPCQAYKDLLCPCSCSLSANEAWQIARCLFSTLLIKAAAHCRLWRMWLQGKGSQLDPASGHFACCCLHHGLLALQGP